MKASDMARFAALMNTLGELYSKEITEVLSEVYWNILKRFEWTEIKKSVSKHIADPDRGRFMPKPADFFYWIEGTSDMRALKAWTQVINTVQQMGTHESIAFDDLTIHAAIDAIGGWIKLGMTKTDYLPFVAQNFKKHYVAFLNNPPQKFPPYLVGVLRSDKPVRIASVPNEIKMLDKVT